MRYIYILAIIFCFTEFAKSTNLEQHYLVQDTICNFIVDRLDNEIFLNDTLKLKEDEKAFAIIRITNDASGNIKKWDLDLFRIIERDTIAFSYSRFHDLELPHRLKPYYNLINNYVKQIKFYPFVKYKNLPDSCIITLKLFFKNRVNTSH